MLDIVVAAWGVYCLGCRLPQPVSATRLKFPSLFHPHQVRFSLQPRPPIPTLSTPTMQSRFFYGGGSDSDSSSSGEEELYSDHEEEEQSEEESSEEDESEESSEEEEGGGGASRFMKDMSESEDSEDEEKVTIVKSAKDKRLEELENTIKLIENAEKINDWVVISGGE